MDEKRMAEIKHLIGDVAKPALGMNIFMTPPAQVDRFHARKICDLQTALMAAYTVGLQAACRAIEVQTEARLRDEARQTVHLGTTMGETEGWT